jgi:hypothetical protein
MTSWHVGSPLSSSSVEALPESVWVRRNFLSSSSVMCGSCTGILWILTENWLLSSSGVSESWLVETVLRHYLGGGGWFANHSNSFIHCSYVICAFKYRIVEFVFVLSYIQSHVWGAIKYSGSQCGDYYLILDSAIDEVWEALSTHVVPPTIRIVVPAGVTVLLGLHNPPSSWTGTMGPSLPGFTIAPCVDSLLCYRIVRAAEVYPSRQS